MLAADRPSWRITIFTQDRAKTAEGKNGPSQQSRPGARQGESDPSSAAAHTAPTHLCPTWGRGFLARIGLTMQPPPDRLTAAIGQTINIDDNDRFRFKGSLRSIKEILPILRVGACVCVLGNGRGKLGGFRSSGSLHHCIIVITPSRHRFIDPGLDGAILNYVMYVVRWRIKRGLRG